jgi:CRISPR-associated protein Cas2
MSQVLVVYDIVSDRARAKISDACMDYGLDRIQFSAFVGKLSRNKQEELMLRIEAILYDGEGRVALIPISEDDWQHKLEISHEG